MNKFETFKEKLILEAENKAYTYLLSKYAHAKIKSSEASLEIKEGPTTGTSTANGKIICYASTPVLNDYAEVGLNMTVNNNDISIESEETVADKIENSLNSSVDYLPTEEVVTANLKDFRLIDAGEKYYEVSHPALSDALIGVVGKQEYKNSPNKSELLQTIATDSISRIASLHTVLSFTGSFVEPKIEKQAAIESIEKKASQEYPTEKPVEPKKSWLTVNAGFESGAKVLVNPTPEGAKKSYPAANWITEPVEVTLVDYAPHAGTLDVIDVIGPNGEEESIYDFNIAEEPNFEDEPDMLHAKMSGGVEQSMQAEQQKLAAEKDKLSNTAVNQLVPTLQSLGFGSARVSEVTPNLSHSDNGFDGEITAMTFLEDKTSTKLVAFPIKIKASQIELPKLPLVRELINKAIDLNERLAEQLTKEALLSLADVDARVEYEKQTVESILKYESKIEKVATENGLSGVQLLGPQSTISLQKHLLPLEAQDMAIGDCVFGDGQYYRLVDKEGNQNDKNSESSSLWKFVVCEPPKEKDEPAIRIPE